jgi:hypothetical protein
VFRVAQPLEESDFVKRKRIASTFNLSQPYFRFEIAIFVLIFLNMVTMGIEHYNQSRVITFTLEISNALFTTIFSLGKFAFFLHV